MVQQAQAGAAPGAAPGEAPTVIQYTEFNKAFDYLNGALFAGSFPRFW